MDHRRLTCPQTAHLAEIELDTDLRGRVVIVGSCSEQGEHGCEYDCVRMLNERIERGRAAEVSCSGVRRVVWPSRAR